MTASLPSDLSHYTAAQDIARAVLTDITAHIVPGASEASVHKACHDLMLAHGATDFWGNTPAFVLAGERLRLSVFDSSYVPSPKLFGENETITIDVGPRVDDYFGDSARTYFLRNGIIVSAAEAGEEEAEAMDFEAYLHGVFIKTVQPDMTFGDVHQKMSALVSENGYENLDLLDAYGHSIAASTDDFIIMEKGNECLLGSVNYFTFEPHIAKVGSSLAVKYEEIYYFDHGLVKMV
ncbi:aminopeptidase P family protein [Gluconobacter cerinus]|uniref:M24 family metallopeptidase n=1 Tax=Gluconobacter cerinus TaxID=38307 RepID=UPI001B8D44E2|nr:M24 family metallopeptidase [Gluconobacter cerinus]MBS1031280.1 aminopeptidase P family protein [Gluconobacter cerinus]